MELIQSDCLEWLKNREDNSIDSIVCDPPYSMNFMGKDWDKTLPNPAIWKECLRVLKPGGYMMVMSGARTYHRMCCDVEDVGFIVHPMIGWIYGSGFPKATDLSKQFDKGVEREVVGVDPIRYGRLKNQLENSVSTGGQWKHGKRDVSITKPSTDQAKKWEGWKFGLQSLKPALEPIGMFQKPHLKPMVKNVEKWGVGAVNIDGCRVETNENLKGGAYCKTGRKEKMTGDSREGKSLGLYEKGKIIINEFVQPQGRHPANLLHDGSDVVEEEFLRQGGNTPSNYRPNKNNKGTSNGVTGWKGTNKTPLDNGGTASRFFYCAKASKRERNEGLEGMPSKITGCLEGNIDLKNNRKIGARPDKKNLPRQNFHPTCKPIALMQWLIKLITPPQGVCLDPFMGSGTTGVACSKLDIDFIGIEKDKEYFKIAKGRIDGAN